MNPLSLLPPQASRHLLAIDLPKFVRCAWHGHVNAKRNEPERVVPTTLKQLARVLRGRQPYHVAIAEDGPESFRKKLSDKYKANRPPKPAALVEVELAVTGALADVGIPPCSFRGIEADDVLHGAVIKAQAIELPVVVVTDDKDALQLVNDARNVTVWDGDEKVWDAAAVRKRWGVGPEQIADLLALAGDTADGIPGVHGWGPKTAAAILNAAAPSDLGALLKDGGHWYVPAKWRDEFMANRETICMGLDLAKLRGDWLLSNPHFELHKVRPLDVASWLMRIAGDL